MLGVRQSDFRQWTDSNHLNIWLILPFRILKAKSRWKKHRALLTAIMRKGPSICLMMNVPKKQIRFLFVLQKFFLKQRSHFLRMSISLSTANFFRGFINMPERLEITILQRKNGCLMGQLLCTVVLLNWEQHLNMIFRRRKISVIKDFQWTRLSIILRYLFQGYGKSISSEKAIREQRQCSSSNIWGHLGFLQPMIFLQKMRGISEMHLSVQTIRTCKRVFTKQQSIWKHFSEICFWTRKMSFIIEIFI